MIRSVKELNDLKGIRVLVRADLNVPIENGRITDPIRLTVAIPTVTYLLSRGARVILLSHASDKKLSLAPVFEYLKTKMTLSFVSDVAGPAAHKAATALRDGEALLLENVRWNPGEETNDPAFARELASLADIYVNNAFPVSHRKHASVVQVPKLLPAYAGFQFLEELTGLTPALTPESPSLAILGGAKLVTKIALLHMLLIKYDAVFIGGALANDFFTAKGYEIGKSLASGGKDAKDLLSNSKILIPDSVVVSGPTGKEVVRAAEVKKEQTICDIAPTSIETLRSQVEKARMILWNGPMGHFETGFTEGTDALAKLVASAPGKKIVGGGDTLASIQNLHLMNKFAFVSTAGGAMLDFLANGTLPGIQALEAE